MAIYKTKNITKDGRQFYFRIKYKDIFGQIHDYSSPKFKNKKDAEIAEAKYRININQLSSYSKITFNQVFMEYIENKKYKVKPQSLLKDTTLFKYLDPIKNIELNKMDLNLYKKWKYYIDTLEYTPQYKNKILGLFRTLINYSSKLYNTSTNVLKYVENYANLELKKEMDFYTYDEYMQFSSVIDDNKWKLFFDILYFMGLRKGECMALTWNDVDLENNTISINKNIVCKLKGHKWVISTPKTKNSTRVLPLPKTLSEQLNRYKLEQMKYKDFNDTWFVFGNTCPLAETTITVKKNKYCDIANIKRIRIHDFRHSCASLLINKGSSITLVTKWLGHAKVTTTLNTYAHMYKNELENIANLLDNI